MLLGFLDRSLAFLKIDQYYYALEDARTTIKLMPKWTKVSGLPFPTHHTKSSDKNKEQNLSPCVVQNLHLNIFSYSIFPFSLPSVVV